MSKILEKEEKDNTTKNKPTEHKLSIGGITYIVVSHFSESSADTAKDIKCALNGVEPVENRVTLETFCNAIEIGEYFREQAIYAYSLGDVDLGTVKAERVLNKIRSKHIQQIRQNDLYKLCRCTLFKNAADFGETMEMLEEYNYLRRETVPAANSCNRSGVMVYINPHIRTQ